LLTILLTRIRIKKEMTKRLNKQITHTLPGKHAEFFGRPMPEEDGLNLKKSKTNMEAFARIRNASELPAGLKCSTFRGTTDKLTHHLILQDNKVLQLCKYCLQGVTKAKKSEKLFQQDPIYGDQPLQFLRKNMTDKQAIAILCARDSGNRPIKEKTFKTIQNFVSQSR
jgi:hypothetical protein